MCKILVVEDHSDVRESMVMMAESFGHVTHSAADGEQAIRWLKRESELPCIVLLDLRMPGMDGWDFLAEMHREPKWSEIGVIVISAVVRRGGPNPVLKARAFWCKPPDEEKFQAIHLHCSQHRDSWPTVSA